MKFNYEKCRFELDSGRYFYSHSHNLSLDEDLQLYIGYDSPHKLNNINYKPLPPLHKLNGKSELEWIMENENTQPFSEEERVEIADYMINLWSKFKNENS